MMNGEVFTGGRGGKRSMRSAEDSNIRRAAGWCRGRVYSLGIPLAVFVSACVLFTYTQQQTSGFIYWFDDWVFYADSSGSYERMKELSFEGNMWRHPLYPLVVHPLFLFLRHVLDLGKREAARSIVALLAAVNTALFCHLLLRSLKDKPAALLFTGLYAAAFSNLVFFSIPETYSLAHIGILGFFLALIRFPPDLSSRRAVLYGAYAATGALLNPPLGLLLGAYCGLLLRRVSWRPALRPVLLAAASALALYLGANLLLLGPEFFGRSQNLAHRWATPANYLDLKNWLNVGVSFFLYSLLSPLDELERSIGLRQFTGYFRSPGLLAVFLVLAGFLAAALWRLRRQLADDLVLGACLWLGVLFIFHVYFNPREALLYSPQALGPFLLILARAWEGIPWRGKPLLLALLAGGMAAVNMACLQG